MQANWMLKHVMEVGLSEVTTWKSLSNRYSQT